MKSTADPILQIENELSEIEREARTFRDALRQLEDRKTRLLTARAVFQELQSKKAGIRKDAPPANDQPDNKPSEGKYFHKAGNTVNLVHYLYTHDNRSTVVNAAHATGIKTRRVRTAFDRLCGSGLMDRDGSDYFMTDDGIAAWKASPFFGKGTVNG